MLREIGDFICDISLGLTVLDGALLQGMGFDDGRDDPFGRHGRISHTISLAISSVIYAMYSR